MNQGQKGNISFEEVYDSYAPIIYRLALSHTCNKEDAEDVVHEVFLKYMKHEKTLKDEDHRRAWLIRVTINQSLDLGRRKQIRSYLPLEDIEEQASIEPELPEIYELLQGIPSKYRSIMVLHYLEGYSVGEIATMLKLSQSAVKMRLSRGRDNLKILMEKEGLNV